MSDTEQTNNKSSPKEVTYNGRVKWFNNRAGYGFVTALNYDQENVDVFVHHSGVKVENEQYRYLVQGEYVSFNISRSDNKDHKSQATNVRGVLGGMLMCETHLEMRKEREDRMQNDRSHERDMDQGGGGGYRQSRGRRQGRQRAYGGGPRDDGGGPRDDGDGFTLARQGHHGHSRESPADNNT